MRLLWHLCAIHLAGSRNRAARLIGSQQRAFSFYEPIPLRQSVISMWSSMSCLLQDITLIFQSFPQPSATLGPDSLRHALPNHFLLDCITSPMQRHASDLTGPDFISTRRSHRLPKRDPRIQRVMLGPDPSRHGYGVLARHVEQHNNKLQAWRSMGKLFYA